MPVEPLRIGDVLRNKYRIERVVGQGGMAIVVAATHVHLQQRVAIKLMRPDVPQDPALIERFLREARAAGRLEGANVARVLDVDTLDHGAPFIVMEYLDGADLAEHVRRNGPLPPAEAVAY